MFQGEASFASDYITDAVAWYLKDGLKYLPKIYQAWCIAVPKRPFREAQGHALSEKLTAGQSPHITQRETNHSKEMKTGL